MTEIQQITADNATGAAVDAHITGNANKAATLFRTASAAHERAASELDGSDPGWRDGNDAAPLTPMPEAPAVTNETDAAVTKLTEMGGAHADLVTSWSGDAAVNIEYARAAFRTIAASDPDLIAAVDRSGIGNDPRILDHLARHGRLSAGMTGDNTIARRNIDMTRSPIASAKPRSGSSAQNELNDLLDANPPGTDGYKNPRVQQRVEALSRMIAGSGNIIGRGGRGA